MEATTSRFPKGKKRKHQPTTSQDSGLSTQDTNIHSQSIENIRALIDAENQAQHGTFCGNSNLDDGRQFIAAKDDEAIFKKPHSLSALVAKLVDNIDMRQESTISVPDTSTSEQRNYKIVDSNTNKIQNITEIRKKVDITTTDSYPKFYNIKPPYCSATIMPKRLPEAFESLPKVGRVDSKEELVEQQNKLMREFLGDDIDDDSFKELEKHCSIDNLRLGTELKLVSNELSLNFLESEEQNLLDPVPELEKGILSTVDKYRMRMELDQNNLYLRCLKYRGVRVLPAHVRARINGGKADKDVPATPADTALTPGQDLLFKLRVYRPFVYHPKEKVFSNGRHPLVAYDLLVPGRRPLRLLRDHILCVNDVGLRVDVSAAPAQPPPMSCKELFPSGYFFINNCFYVDRGAGCCDQSAVVRDWARKKGIGDFAVRDMDGVTFEDLQVKLGHPEVYVHQGNCEHLFTFSEARLLAARDPGSYPVHGVAARAQAVYCTTCAEFPTKYLVTGCELVPFDPAMFCEACLKLYLYKDGKKVRDFKVYQYHYNDIGLSRA